MGGGEYDQVTLFECTKYHNEAHHFVQLIYNNKKKKESTQINSKNHGNVNF
jgi:hypothetical protein